MTPERWQQVKEIYGLALERRADERAAFLDEACAGDLSLRAEVDSLIEYHEQAEYFLESPRIEDAVRLLINDRKEKKEIEGTIALLEQLIGQVLDGKYRIEKILGQ